MMWALLVAATPATAQPGAGRWLAGEVMVDEAAAKPEDRFTLACKGAACKPLQCRWRDDAGDHELVFPGGASASYTGPASPAASLVLERADACENCRAQYLHLYWRDPARPAGGILTLLWSGLEFSRGGEGRMGGFASWPNQQPAQMRCSAR